MAEGVFRAIAAEEGVAAEADSAGTSDWHIGDAPDRRAVAEARQRGYDIADLRARQFKREDFRDFDLIVAMDMDNLARIEAVRPVGLQTPARLFMDFAPDLRVSEVPDPYYGGNFSQVLDMIETASRGLALHLKTQS